MDNLVYGDLKNPSKEAAEKFLADLPKLLPDDPETAAILADATAEAMAEVLTQRRGGAEEDPSRPSQKSQTSRDEITQETAEKLYEEIMSK